LAIKQGERGTALPWVEWRYMKLVVRCLTMFLKLHPGEGDAPPLSHDQLAQCPRDEVNQGQHKRIIHIIH